uniref:RloB domain-containing protein n=1 Tax=Magnetococcus massalia (strain MO-1) TaxID=451514 RepID=A0A1S7LF61_MAGMO|nr:protein of unknown function [Candidatus Magnetococcus massalia]
MVRRERKHRSHMQQLERPRQVEPLAPRLFIFAEGQITEPRYIEAFEKLTRLKVTFIDDIHTNPDGLVQAALTKVKKLRRAQRSRHADAEDRMDFQVWVLFDQDIPQEHPENKIAQLMKAFELARQDGIQIGYTSPCFEQWLLLHFEQQRHTLSNRELQSRLKNSGHIPNYDHNRGASGEITSILNEARFHSAKRRAESINTTWLSTQYDPQKPDRSLAIASPYSDIYRLFDVMWEHRRFEE